MSFSDVHAGDPINAANVQQLIDALKGTTGKGVPLSPTAVNSSTAYALTVENVETTNSRALNVLKSDGSTLIKADGTGVTLGSPITLPASSINGSVLQNASVQNASLAVNVARANLLTNGGMEVWQRGAGPYTASGAYTADRWIAALAGTDSVSVTRVAAASGQPGQYAAQLAFTLGTGAGGSALYQQLQKTDEPVVGQPLGFAIWVTCSVAGAVAAYINSNGTGGSELQTANPAGASVLYVSYSVPTDATYVIVGVRLKASATVTVDNACLVFGSQPANFAPMHPADDLARCLRYYEVVGGNGTSDVMVRGYVGSAGEAVDASFRFQAQKAITPTMTKVGTWGTGNAGQPTLLFPTTGGFRLEIIATAANNDTYAFNNAVGTYVTAESNP
jgi:hypothetical protein